MWLLANTLLGTALVAGGTNAWNQIWERDVDARMARTRGRPLPSGRLAASHAMWFASAITIIGVIYLGVTVNLVTASLAALTFASYVLLYTPLKRRTSLNTLVGAVPGALPIVGGWTAAGGRLDVAVAALFWILFLWQLPHFLALAWIYREDYRAGGLKMLSVGDDDGRDTARMALLYAMALLPISLLPTLLGVTGGPPPMIPFHRLLITTGIVFCGGFAIWSLWRGEMALGIGFAALGVGLTYYLRHLRRFIGR